MNDNLLHGITSISKAKKIIHSKVHHQALTLALLYENGLLTLFSQTPEGHEFWVNRVNIHEDW